MTDELFQVRKSLIPLGDSNRERAPINGFGAQLVVDLLTQLQLAGRIFHIQIGTEDAPATATAAIDDQLAFMLVDQSSTLFAMMPVFAQVKVANWSTTTLFNTMLEADLAKVRYSSGGSAFTPRNVRGDSPATFQGAAYVAGGSDIVAAAKSAVPDSVELWRGTNVEDAQATPAAGDADIAFAYSARTHPLAIGVGASSFIVHHGGATADPASYGMLQVAQFEKSFIV